MFLERSRQKSQNVFKNIYFYDAIRDGRLVDMLIKHAHFECIFAAFSFYPQWKVIKLFIRYAKGNINEEQLIEEKAFIDGSVSSIEPFVESCFQVQI